MKDIGHFSHLAPAPKNKAEDGTAFLPSNPSCRAVRHNFFEIATETAVGDQQIVPAKAGKQRRKATPYFIQGKIIQDFQRKMFELQVKTSAKIMSEANIFLPVQDKER